MRLTRKRSTTKNIIIDKSVDIEKMIIEQITYLNGILRDFKKQNNTQNDNVQLSNTTPYAPKEKIIEDKIVKEIEQKVIKTINESDESDIEEDREEQLETIEEEELEVEPVVEPVVFNLDNILI